jgi:hypothetical protein
MGKSVRAMVEVSDLYTPRSQLWGYGYADLAKLLGLEEQTLRLWVSEGRLNPGDLESLIKVASWRCPHLTTAAS